MQVSATTMLSICLSGCPQLALSALYSTSRLVSSSSAIPSSSGRSRCAMKRIQSWRLVMFDILLLLHVGQRLRDLAEQVIVHHLAGNRRRRGAAVPAVLGQHRQCDPGLFGRSESDEPGMVAMPLVYPFLLLFFSLLS